MGWLLCYLVVCLSYLLLLCTCNDILIPGQSITGNQTLDSSIGSFSLGFFKPENSNKYFLGIQINTFPYTALVWIANKESPLDSPGLFMLSSDGNLVVLDHTTNLTVWSSNASIPTASALNQTTARLADTGNLILSFEGVTIWQSFDHPSDTMLPSLKITLNKKTGKRKRLTTWTAFNDPQPGKYTLVLDPQVPLQGFVWNGTHPYLRTSVFVGKNTIKVYQNPDGISIFTSYNSVSDDEVYFFYNVSDSSVKFRSWLSPTGSVKQLLWDSSSKTWRELQIESVESVKLPDHTVMINNMSMSRCESECGRNCSCTAYASVNGTADGSTWKCLVWFGELLDLVEAKSSAAGDIYIRFGDSHLDAESVSVSSLKRTLVIALVYAAVGLLTVTTGYFLWKKKMGRIARRVSENDTELPFFSLRSILAATNNFSDGNTLGDGGFGPVYKGILSENQEVAVKRLSKKSGQGHHEFMNELKLIAKLQHTNLVRLLGCCMDEDELILIYEYMPNRSLDKYLFDPVERTKLDWGTRFRIIQGIAQGVLYLHRYSRLKIIHRDLKAGNVLLDGGMNPKVSDFGMARIFDTSQIEANTNKVAGTYGYMSPEYAQYGHFSEKLDVFSFGVLLLELVTGRRNSSLHTSENSQTLAQWIWVYWKEDKATEVIDESVRETCGNDEALRCIHVGLLCVQEAPADRPTMSAVILMLEGDEATSLPPSKEPAFSTGLNSTSVANNATPSQNEVTVTLPRPR